MMVFWRRKKTNILYNVCSKNIQFHAISKNAVLHKYTWAQISGRQTLGLTRGSPLLLYKKNAGGEPRVEPVVWCPEMWPLYIKQVLMKICNMLYIIDFLMLS
jgi:hypothetical protein